MVDEWERENIILTNWIPLRVKYLTQSHLMDSLISTGGKGESADKIRSWTKKRSVKIKNIQPLDIVTSSVEDRPVIRIHIIKTTCRKEEHLPDERTIIDRFIEGETQLRSDMISSGYSRTRCQRSVCANESIASRWERSDTLVCKFSYDSSFWYNWGRRHT